MQNTKRNKPLVICLNAYTLHSKSPFHRKRSPLPLKGQAVAASPTGFMLDFLQRRPLKGSFCVLHSAFCTQKLSPSGEGARQGGRGKFCVLRFALNQVWKSFALSYSASVVRFMPSFFIVLSSSLERIAVECISQPFSFEI